MAPDSVPLLAQAEASLSQILETNGVFDYSHSYGLEDELLSVSWEEAMHHYEILVSKTEFEEQLAIEGHSARYQGCRAEASTHFGVSHSSLLHTNLSAQYGMLKGLDAEDYQVKTSLQ